MAVISGVYAIVCRENGKSYVGQAANILRRWSEHTRRLDSGKHVNPRLQRAWAKYGRDNFLFAVLEECPPECLTNTEQFFMDRLQSADPEIGYNLCPAAGSPLGYKHSAEARANMSSGMRGNTNWLGKKHSKESLAKMSVVQRGKKMSLEARAKMRGNTNCAGRVCSAETRAKMSAALRGRALSAEHREKLRERVVSPEHRKKLSIAKIGNSNASGSRSAESRMKMSLAALARRKAGVPSQP